MKIEPALSELSSLLRATADRWSLDAAGSRAFQHSPLPTVLADAATLRIVAVNESFVRSIGRCAEDLLNQTLLEIFIRPKDDGPFVGKLSNPDPLLPMRALQICRDSRQLEVELTGYAIADGKRSLVAFISQDITARIRYESRQREKQGLLDRLAHHDPLTSLPNRLYLAAHLPNAIEQARRNGQILAMLFLDLDRFKHINDSHGHETGDRLLQVVAARIREATRQQDMVIRMGGDEFIVILKDVADLAQVEIAAARIIDSVSRPVDIGGQNLVTSASIGVSLFPRDGGDVGELLRHSDTAMYQAKERGRSNCQMFSPLMDRQLKQRMIIESQLREAILHGQLDVHYQPIVDLESQRVVAMESLLRWKHPRFGLIPPARFISIAEETGLIVPIGEFVLGRVLQDAAMWQARAGRLVPISINVSAIQLQRANLPLLIAERTREHGFHPSMLQIELTESAIFERREGRNGELNQDAVAHLRDLGVHIAIDDFGTGYSSLSYLRHWRVDSLKIDRSFVRDVVTNPSDLAIVGAITAMARHLNVSVTAEGIEGWQQLAKLRELGCQLAQGHLFSKAVPAEHCVPFLSGERIDLTGWSRSPAGLEATGLHAALLQEMLEPDSTK